MSATMKTAKVATADAWKFSACIAFALALLAAFIALLHH